MWKRSRKKIYQFSHMENSHTIIKRILLKTCIEHSLIHVSDEGHQSILITFNLNCRTVFKITTTIYIYKIKQHQ